MTKNHLTQQCFLMSFIILLNLACKNTTEKGEITAKTKKSMVTVLDTSVTNPLFKIAPLEYAVRSEQALKHLAQFEFDEWANMLADSVVFSFPNGDATTRTTLHGKNDVVKWWKNWQLTSGIEAMEMRDFNHIPINVIDHPSGGFPMGIYDIVYFTTEMIFNGKSVGLRMNFSVHFNSNKKIDHYATYYDKNVIFQSIGKIVMDETNTKK